MQKVPGLYFGPSDLHGRGVFCAHPIKSGDLIEIAPVLPLKDTLLKELEDSILYNYYFLWGKEQRVPAIVLGFGSLYNHSSTPNATFRPDFQSRCMFFTALEEIPAGDEITIDFHEGNPDEDVWFVENR